MPKETRTPNGEAPAAGKITPETDAAVTSDVQPDFSNVPPENLAFEKFKFNPRYVVPNDVALALGYRGGDDRSPIGRIQQAALQMAEAFCDACRDIEARGPILAGIAGFSLQLEGQLNRLK